MNEQLIRAIELADDGNWDEAHRIVQQFEDPLACWLHANLHREEGDLGNAQYWYRRAGKSSVDAAFAEERSVIRKAIEREFPDARAFQRPGFDFMPEKADDRDYDHDVMRKDTDA